MGPLILSGWKPHLILTFFSLIAAPGCWTLAEEAASSDRDEWHKLFLAGKLAGHMRIVERQLADGGFVTTMMQKLVLKRDTTVLETEATSSVEEDREGRIRGFSVRQRLSSQISEVVGKLAGADLEITESDGDPGPGSKKTPRRSRLPSDPTAVGPHRMERILDEKLRAAGDSVELRVFIPELRKFGLQKSSLEAEETLELDGTRQELRRIRSTLDLLAEIPTLQWIDPAGNLQKSTMPLLGTELKTLRSTMAKILKSDLTSPPEIFLATSVPVEGRVDPSRNHITYKITAKKQALPFGGNRKLFPAAGQEEIRPGTREERWLRVKRVPHGNPLQLPISPAPEMDEYLRPNAWIQSDDELIRAAARKAQGGETDAVQASLKLESWVHDTIVRKNLGTAFASAREVLKEKEGDCTEHAVLLAALLRAIGVPSRVVAGLVYYNGMFVGHMWTEAYLRDWFPLDATQARGFVGPDHIALSVSSLDSATVADIFLDIVPVIGSVTIEVVESGE